MTGVTDEKPTLSVRGLAVSFGGRAGARVRAVDGASMTVYPRQTLAVVGESGCGKSVTALSMLRLIPSPPGRIDAGSALFAQGNEAPGVDLLAADERQLRSIRGGQIAMIFQEPMTSLNPVFTVGEQIVEAVRLHRRIGRGAARDVALQAMGDVGIENPPGRIDQYPHQFSGGMRQRVMIAMALACRPRLLIADEPTTALDVTIQAQILELLRSLRESRGMSLMLITHDMGAVAENADVVCVMYAGRVVEYAPVRELFAAPLHPYTRGLLASIPRPGQRRERLVTIREVIDDPRQFEGLLLPGGVGLRAWWPSHQPPAKLRPRSGIAGDYALVQVREAHWVGVWRTDGVGDENPAPDIRQGREPALSSHA